MLCNGVYRIVEGNCGSVSVNIITSIIIDEGFIFALHSTTRRKLRRQFFLSK